MTKTDKIHNCACAEFNDGRRPISMTGELPLCRRPP